MAPYLEDMMDKEKTISYKELAKAVGVQVLSAIFPDYDWSKKKTHMRLWDDYAVSYHKSMFNGYPCFYVTHSGIEFVFVPNDYEEKTISSNFKTSFMITDDGEQAPTGSGGCFHVTRNGDNLSISASSRPTKEATKTLISYIRKNKWIENIIDDDEEKTIPEFIIDLKNWVSSSTVQESIYVEKMINIILKETGILLESRSFYDPSAIWLHGGPRELRTGKLTRYGKNNSDYGALFFCKDDVEGRWYTSTYAKKLLGVKGKIWKTKISCPENTIFDLTNPVHKLKLRNSIGKEHYNSILDSKSTSGHLDWSSVDDELFGELGFKGCIFQERPKGMETGWPPSSGFSVLKNNLLSIGIFDAADAHIVGEVDMEGLENESLMEYIKNG